ncbi:MAG: LysR family transcriptional regulator [Giesbergeria sp.]|nr:LysR family transcriptional regulator [Giesbergeria sp.]
MNITLRQLRALVALVRSGSFTQAAASLHLTQSALSGQIKELEAALGVRLVERSTRRIGLTEAGKGLYPLVDKILQDLEAVLHGVDDIKALRQGVVRVAAPQLLACTLLPQVIAAFRAQHPGVRVQLLDCAVDRVLACVASGEVDLGLGPQRPTVPGVDAQPLCDWPFMAVLPAAHPLLQHERVTWAQLLEQPFIALQGQFTELLASDLHGVVHKAPLRPRHEVAFMSTALSLVQAGEGVTVCLPYAADLVRMHHLHLRPLHRPTLQRRFQVYQRVGGTLAPATERFTQVLLGWMAAQGWGQAGA